MNGIYEIGQLENVYRGDIEEFLNKPTKADKPATLADEVGEEQRALLKQAAENSIVDILRGPGLMNHARGVEV